MFGEGIPRGRGAAPTEDETVVGIVISRLRYVLEEKETNDSVFPV